MGSEMKPFMLLLLFIGFLAAHYHDRTSVRKAHSSHVNCCPVPLLSSLAAAPHTGAHITGDGN